jgi:hypothetical protein
MAAAEKKITKTAELVTLERRVIRNLGTLVEVCRILADNNSLKNHTRASPVFTKRD